MGDFQIEKGVSLNTVRASKYPFRDMEVGDSFFVEGDGAAATLVRYASVNEQRKSGKRFSTRRVEGGYRCWRIA
jgi:hypothetical protein